MNELTAIFPGDSEMARVMREKDWTDTALGDPRTWPEALKTPLRMLLTTRFEMWLGWGDDLNFFYNDAYIPTLGIKHPKMLGRPFREVWAEVYDEVAGQVERVRAGAATWNKSLLLLLERSGFPEETYHSFSYSPLHLPDGSVGGLLCIVSEDTANIIGERRLETMRQLGLGLSQATDRPDIVSAVMAAFATNRRDFPFVALQLNDHVDRMDAMKSAGTANAHRQECQAGNPPAETLFARIAPALPADILEAGVLFNLPEREDWPTGDWDRAPVRAIAMPIPGAGTAERAGTLVLALNPYCVDLADILPTVRLLAGQIGGALANVATLEAERRRADRMWQVSRDLMVVVDAGGVFRAVSPSWTRILGHPIETVIGRPFADFMHPDDVTASSAALAEALNATELNNYENRFRALDGSYHRIEWHTTLEEGQVYAYGRDVTDRRLVEEKLSDSEEQFRHLVQGVTDYAIYMIDLEGNVSSWNEGARRIKGYEPDEIIGSHFSRFYTPEDRERGEPARALETARTEGRFLAEGWRVRKSGERFRASVVIDAIRDDMGKPIGFAKITRDVTEREQAQRDLEVAREALFQAQKMEAIGQLTGGVAHDFNNLLMAISSSLDLLSRRTGDDPLSRRLLDNAIEGAKRGATLTQRMLAFARRQELNVGRVDVPQLLSGMSDLVQRSIGPEWPISTSFPLKLPSIRADANQLEMALLNLIVNARDATPGGGPILISASCEDVAGEGPAKLAAGTYVRLVVRDEGQGMDAETLRRATEPFFTTKGVGKGTGLGLPMVHGMAQQIGGTFELLSKAGEGASAVLWLPVAEPEPVCVTAAAEDAQVTRDTPRLTILTVDDDALVLINTAALLEDLGHTVIEAGSAAQALEYFSARNDIDLLITDQAMPGMTGVDLVAAVDAIRAGTPVIIASGYGEGVDIPGRQLVRLGKPFNQERLSEAIEEAVG
ncbi:PAS domain S-box protein (plasmid) [Novosphingobium sp. BL-8A]|uniref:PAS domain S-box protein n=1 Tax=Novosphingobium sp. BL-8A TaxID=3127639 RepID=UPI00375815F2